MKQFIIPIVTAGVSQIIPLTTKYHVAENREREQQILIYGTKYTALSGRFFFRGDDFVFRHILSSMAFRSVRRGGSNGCAGDEDVGICSFFYVCIWNPVADSFREEKNWVCGYC